MAKTKVKIDKDKCIGCGTCTALCPEYFTLEGDKAEVIKAEVDDGSCVAEAQSSCPTLAISVQED